MGDNLFFAEKDCKLFKLAVEKSVDGIIIGDAEGYIKYVNDALMKMYGGTDKNDLIGKHIIDFVADFDRQRALECSLESVRTGQGWKGQFTALNAKGEMMPIELTAAPIKDENGVSIAFIDIIRDVRDRVHTEEKLKEAHRKLELANEKLLVVGGIVRHDIANKICTLNMSAYLAKKKESLEQLLEATAVVSAQINKILSFSKDYEMLGKEELNYFDAGKTFNDVLARVPRLDLKVVNECCGLEVLADSMLKELFFNLIDNTLKYGKTTSQIKLSYSQGSGQLKLVYEDDGVGIPADMKPKLFTKGFGKGSGLGLYLIKKTLEVYGWQIQETGIEGKSARFEITIPQTCCKQPTTQQSQES
jgi:PAS domain S-box-containing protein